MPVFVILRQRTLVITFKSIVCTPDLFFCGFLPPEQDVWSSGVGRGALWPARISIAVEKQQGPIHQIFIYLFIFRNIHTHKSRSRFLENGVLRRCRLIYSAFGRRQFGLFFFSSPIASFYFAYFPEDPWTGWIIRICGDVGSSRR